jgi:ubiquinone/menaquinone biosynthesis C-methylase UbiE
MPDVYAAITEVEAEVVERIADVLEVSAADPQHREMVAAYLADLAPSDGARVLEVGCGTGAVARMLAAWPGVGEMVGVDPSPILLAKARELAQGIGVVTFVEGDGRLRFDDEDFDAVVLHRVLSHVPGPERVLAEASRVLRPRGGLAVFEGDYTTITQIDEPDYMLGIADRGADALVAAGAAGAELGEALKAEARRRVGDGAFFGHIAYASLTVRKPQ